MPNCYGIYFSITCYYYGHWCQHWAEESDAQHIFQNHHLRLYFRLWQFGSAASATTELSKTYDCTKIELEAVIDQDASREDNLARLSQQFFQSVNTIEHCDREQDNVDAASSTDSDSASSSADADAAICASDGRPRPMM